MCDTFIALPTATRDHHTILGKNSDREPDEAQAILSVDRAEPKSNRLQCTYIEIPQVEETFACVLSKPFQMWGAEMGVNEFGLAIGNEAVFTKVRQAKRNDGLTGMDLVRLALERCRSATEGLELIVELLETYGQDACGGYRNKSFFYHNSFVIADPKDAWILETAGKQWAARQVRNIDSISNRLSLSSADRFSSGAREQAKAAGWWNGQEPFDFARTYSDRLYTWAGRGSTRQACTRASLEIQQGQLIAHDAMRILQTHNLPDGQFAPRRATTGSVCMHRTGFLNPSDTTGSMVAVLRSGKPHTVWLTGTPHPCLSVYVPYFSGIPVPAEMGFPGARPDGSLWWKARELHQWIGNDYQHRREAIQEERTALQQSFVDAEQALLSSHPSRAELREFNDLCVRKTLDMLDGWISGIKVG